QQEHPEDGHEKDGAQRPRLHNARGCSRIASAHSVQRKGDDAVAALEVELDVAAGGNDDVLLAADGVGGWRRVDAGAGIERPEDLAVTGVIGVELAVALAGEDAAAGGREHAPDHRLGRLYLPADLAGVVVDRGDVAPLLLARDHLEGAAEPKLAAGVGRA